MIYEIVDFRHLVSDWYNEFLPNKCPDKAKAVEDAGIIYLDSVSIDTKFKKSTTRFMLEKLEQIQGGDKGKTCIIVREPKPVDNVRLRPMLKLVEESKVIGEEGKLKVLHVANRRYIPISSDILVRQGKEFDSFLDDVFDSMMKINVAKMKFVKSPSLDMTDVKSAMEDFFPKSSLKWHVPSEKTIHIDAKSANEMLQPLFVRMIGGKVSDQGTLKYMSRCKRSMIEDLEKVV